jgi:hypothetical protein
MKENWSPSQQSFERLLAWLHPDAQEAAQRYEKIRLRLVLFFTSNGCGEADEHLTDITFDRVSKKLEEGSIPEPFVGEKALYFLGFARRIRLEHIRARNLVETRFPLIDRDDDRSEKEDEDSCLEECGRRILELEDHWLAVEYYRFEKAAKIAHRKSLAQQVSLTLAGLRTRVHRIRDNLRPCIEECLERRIH